MRVGDLVSYDNQPIDEKVFLEIKNIDYADGILYVPEDSSKNSSSVAKYTTKEISLENPSDRIDSLEHVTAQEKPQRAKVLAVGSGHYEFGHHVPLEVEVGDEILFSKYGGTEIKEGGRDYLILRESDILAVIGKPAKGKK